MTKIIQRHDTSANWSTINPVLALGEMGVETDTNKFKFGDGTTSYNELPYAAGEGGGTGGSGTTITSKDGTTSYNKLALGDGLIVDTGDIPWTNPQMSSNSQDGYVASASSDDHTLGAQIWKAFDKDTTTPEDTWYTGPASMPQWIMLECPEPVRLTSCMIMNEVSTPESFRSGYIQGSNDGSNFDTLYTITDRPNTTGLQVTYTFDNNKYYKYLRVYCTASYGSSGLSIQEIEFSGYVKSEGAVHRLDVNVENSIKLSVTETLDTTHFEFENGTVNEIDNTFRCSGDSRIIINPNIASANLIVLKARWRFETDTQNVKNLLANMAGAVDSTLPWIDCYTSYDLWFPGKNTVGNFPGYNWRNLTLTIDKVNGSLTFYQEDDNGNITDNWSGYNTGTGRDTSTRWGFMRHPASNSAVIVDTHSLVLIEDGVKYPYYQGNEYTIKHIVIGSGLQASIDSKNNTSAISGQDVKTFTGYSDTGTLVLKSINGVLQWVAEA